MASVNVCTKLKLLINPGILTMFYFKIGVTLYCSSSLLLFVERIFKIGLNGCRVYFQRQTKVALWILGLILSAQSMVLVFAVLIIIWLCSV